MASALPKTYKAAVFNKANEKLAIEDIELKQPEQGHVLIKILANGVCHSDALVQSGGMGNPLWVDLLDLQSSYPSRTKLTLRVA